MDVRIDLRSLICLAKEEYLTKDNISLVVCGFGPDGQAVELAWPPSIPTSEEIVKEAGKLDWLFKGDEQALHVWQGEIAEGAQVGLGVFVFRRAGANHYELVKSILKSARPFLVNGAGITASAFTKRKAGGLVGERVASWVVDATIDLLSVDGLAESQQQLVGSLEIVAGVRNGNLIADVTPGQGSSVNGWRRGLTVYPTPSKSGKTMRLVLGASSARYGIEVQVRNISGKTEKLPGGVCYQWVEPDESRV